MASSAKSVGVFAQVSGAEITAGTEAALRSFSPNDIRLMAEAHAPVEFADNVFRVQDDGDATKEIAFQASGITTGNTRTITMPDTNVNLGDIATNNAKVTNATHTGDVTGSTALTIGTAVVDVAMLSNGTDGELITWDASGVADTVAVGTAGQVLTSNGIGAAPTFQASPGENTEFADDVFRIQDNGDASKELAFEVVAITTSTTRTITMPDTNVDLGDIATNNAKVSNATHTGDVTGSTALTIGTAVVDVAMLSNGTDGELITWDASGVADTVAVGTAGQVLTSNGTGAAPTFQASPGENTEFADDVFRIQDNGDASKEIAFEAAAITTSTTRTITMPDTNVDLGDIATNNAKVSNATHTGDVTGATALTIASAVVTVAMLANGTDGELITWDASGVADTVAVGSAGEVLTSNGAGAAPAFAATAAGDSNKESINQTTHGFTVGDILKFDSGVFADAQADTAANAEAVGIVESITDVDNFIIVYGGRISGLSGLTVNTVHFLSEATAALLTTTEPSGTDISKPMLLATSATSGIVMNMRGLSTVADIPFELTINITPDQTTAITTGTGKWTFRMPTAMTVTNVRIGAAIAPTDADIIVDLNEGGVTILSTKLSIDATETTSETATTPAVISDPDLADDAEITVDFDQVGSTIAGAGLVLSLVGTRP